MSLSPDYLEIYFHFLGVPRSLGCLGETLIKPLIALDIRLVQM
jgi:hypothetical protein